MANQQANDSRDADRDGRLGIPPRRVDVGAIERELAALWQSAGQDGDEAVTRACALNLVVHVDNEEAATAASESIAHASTHDPNRAIVVIAEPTAEPSLDAWISAHCFLPAPHSPQVCSEQIVISARGDAVDHAPGIVLPLLVADLPVVLWWIGDPPIGDDSFERFADAAHRLILDSAEFLDPRDKLPRLARRASGPLRQPAISDLSWARLTSWRELTAQFFDAPEMLGYLGDVRSVSIEYAVRPQARANPSQAALLLGWLGSRLGWQLEPGSPTPIEGAASRFRSADGDVVESEFIPAERPDVAPGSIVGLTIRSTGRTSATFSIESEPGGSCVVTRADIEGRLPIERTICPTPPTIHNLLCQELELVGRDQVYEEALALLVGSTGDDR